MSEYVDKLRTLGFARKRGTARRVDKVNEDNGTQAGYEVEHWDDHRDAVATPGAVVVRRKIDKEA